jgi:hypothetical protein
MYTIWVTPNHIHLGKFHCIKDSYLLPRIDKMMDWICGLEIFTKLDLKSGYNQIQIRPGDEWKTTFMMPFGPYQMWVMTFGFANALSCFQ